MRRLTLTLALTAGLIAGCGGNAHPTYTATPLPKAVLGHACNPQDYVMQCALTPPPVGLKPGGPALVYGLDFAWGGPRSCSAMRALGAKFGEGYLSYDRTGKNLDVGLVNTFHACGIPTVVVWETTATRTLDGFAAGQSDAREAARQAAALGNKTRPIIFAIDCDCAGASIYPYFQGVHSILGARDDAYGGYNQVNYLFDHGVVGRQNQQTYAWSSGRWLPSGIAPLEQYLNGLTYDHDRALLADYGQFPYTAPKPPGPTPSSLIKQRDGWLHQYHARRCTMPVFGPAYCRVFADLVVKVQTKLTREHPVCWGKHSTPTLPVCQIVRPRVSIRSRARDASYNAAQGRGCKAPNGMTWIDRRDCNQFVRRAEYFDRLVHADLKTWGPRKARS